MSYTADEETRGEDVDIPNHTIIRRVGDGGMAIVYLAIQDSLKRPVALKVLRTNAQQDPEMADRFVNEAETIAKLDHPNIVGIHEVGQTPDGQLYYSMPFLDHGDLRTFQYAHDADLVALIRRLCDALAYAHDKGVIHRDIKPENVLFDRFGNAQIADFGIALTQGNRRWTKEGYIVGSAKYMSPEQSQARSVDERTDVYGIGIILYELLTGKVPFDSDDEVSILVAHVSDSVPLLPPETRHWQPLINRCLAKRPEDRFASAPALKNALTRIPGSALGRWLVRWQVTLAAEWERWRNTVMLGGALAATAVAAAYLAHWRLTGTVDPVPPAVPPALKTVETPGGDRFQSPALTASDEPPEPPPPALSRQEIDRLLAEGFDRMFRNRLTRPAEDNAASRFLEILGHYPDHPEAGRGLTEVIHQYRNFIVSELNSERYADALGHARDIVRLMQSSGWTLDDLPQLAGPVILASERAAAAQIDRLDRATGEKAIQPALVLLGDARLAELQARLKSIPGSGEQLASGVGLNTVFVSPSLAKPGGLTRTIASGFAVTPTEITRAQYAEFVSERSWPETPCRHASSSTALFSNLSWRETGKVEQDPDHPVICVSWRDAVAYAEWMSARSGHLYRLPTDSEWQHMAWVGHEADIACQTGNVAGTESGPLRYIRQSLSCDDGFLYTAPVSLFQSNRLGLFDLRGNVREWTSSCPDQATRMSRLIGKLSAREAEACQRRIVRGTSWMDGRGATMLGLAEPAKIGQAFTFVGFRLVRDLAAERERRSQN